MGEVLCGWVRIRSGGSLRRRRPSARRGPVSAGRQDCGAAFTLFLRRHHCRVCGRVLCHPCSAARPRGRRVCRDCIRLPMDTPDPLSPPAPGASAGLWDGGAGAAEDGGASRPGSRGWGGVWGVGGGDGPGGFSRTSSSDGLDDPWACSAAAAAAALRPPSSVGSERDGPGGRRGNGWAVGVDSESVGEWLGAVGRGRDEVRPRGGADGGGGDGGGEGEAGAGGWRPGGWEWEWVGDVRVPDFTGETLGYS